MRSSVAARKSKLRELFADYDAPREEFYKQSAFHDTQIKSNRMRFGESRRALVEATTSDEWSVLSKTESKTTNALANSLLSI
jgi:hypothetical protein